MSTINFAVGRDTLDGVSLTHGSVHWHFIRKRFSDNILVLSQSVSKSLIPAGNPIEIPVTALGEAVSITVVVDGQSTTGLYKIPFGEIEYKDLVEVDRESLEPTAEPEPEWWAVAKSTIIGGTVNASGDLMLTRSDGVIINAGHVVGQDGKDGKDGKDGVNGSNGKDGIDGQDGQDGLNGVDGKDGLGVILRDALVSDLPASFASGITISNVSSANGWPECFGTVVTTKRYTGRTIQVLTPNSLSKEYVRIESAGVWSTFKTRALASMV